MKLPVLAVSMICSFLLNGCASPLRIATSDQSNATTHQSGNGLSIQYLGVGGHRLQVGEEVILTAPSFTNPNFLLTGPFMPLRSDHQRIDELMPESNSAQMLLVGHAHYDHLLDVPHVLLKHAPDAHLYGSETTINTVSAVIPAERMTALDTSMGTREQLGTWHYSRSGRSRIMGLKSSHAPHFMGIKLMQGRYDEPQKKLPWHSFGWKEGQTLAYLIDFLDDQQQPIYRVFYQDSASAEIDGVVPDLADGKPIDVAIICPASFAQVEQYPESIIRNTQARHFILGHWEDFFGNDPRGKQKFVRATDQKAFLERLTAALPASSHWTLPQLFDTYHFPQQEP